MAIFAAMVDRMDENIGRIVADLTARGELDNTLTVFLSDNGACAEWKPNGFDIRSGNNNILHTGDDLDHMGGAGTYHSVGSGWANLSNTPWRLYKHFNHKGGVSTPLIVHWPSRIGRPGAIKSGMGHIIDLVPTLMDAAGAEYPTEFAGRRTIPLPGQSFLSILDGSDQVERTLYFEHEGHRAIRKGSFKLVARRGRA
jgi:arylsulfatase A-like enzyme